MGELMTDLLDAPPVSEPSPPVAAVEAAEPGVPWYRNPDVLRVLRIVATVVTVVGSSLFVLAQLHPDLIFFTNSTPAGGDMGAHVWGPAYLRDHLLPHFRLTGWAPDWYAGFPMYHFYMVMPALFVVLLDVLLPYGIALKIISVVGLVTLPVAIWFLGRMGRLPFPVPELFSVAAVFFLFDENFTIYGGNIASTMAGEFSFSIALSFAFFFFGVFAFGLRTGRLRPLAAVLFALTVLSHLIVAFFAIIGAVLMFLFWLDRRRFLYAASVGLVGSLLTAFWILPFFWRGPYLTDMFYERRLDFGEMFFPHTPFWNVVITGLAVIGLVGAIARRQRIGIWLGALCVFYAVWARVWPQSHLLNARLLPFLYLTRYMLMAMGVVEVGRAVGRLIAPENATADRVARGVTWATSLLLALGALALHLQIVPGLKQYYDQGDARWEYGLARQNLGVKSDPAFVDDWAKWNYSGYEAKDAYGEYHGIVTTMDRLGQERGCGRALWENNNDQDKYGTPMALMLLPFWTDGCIGSMEGLFFEAAGTTPYHFLSAAALSEGSSNPVRRLRYENGDVARGVQYLQALGVRYYLAYNPSVTDQADEHPDLTQVAESGPWKVYEVAGSELVTPLITQPVVVEDLPTSPLRTGKAKDAWLEVGASFFQTPDVWGALPAADGPSSWQRIAVAPVPDATGAVRETDDRYLAEVAPTTEIEPVDLPAVAVSDITTDDDRISFRVDQVGVPVLVKASYFPNWKVSGADGPYRVAPNLMVVVPTANDVSLHYGYTWVDLLAYALTLLGVGGLFVLWRRGPVRYPDGQLELVAAGEPADTATTVDEEPLLFLAWDEPEDLPNPARPGAWSPPASDEPPTGPVPVMADAPEVEVPVEVAPGDEVAEVPAAETTDHGVVDHRAGDDSTAEGPEADTAGRDMPDDGTRLG